MEITNEAILPQQAKVHPCIGEVWLLSRFVSQMLQIKGRLTVETLVYGLYWRSLTYKLVFATFLRMELLACDTAFSGFPFSLAVTQL